MLTGHKLTGRMGSAVRFAVAERGKTMRCSHPLCPFPATRQQYAAGIEAADFALDPWDASHSEPVCAGHAGRDSWPLVESDATS